MKLKRNFINVYSMFAVIILLLLIPSSSAFPSLTFAKSPYQSGYDHGCDDAGISDSSDRYINQPEKGPAFHTSEFMNGYDSGFNSCSSYDNANNYNAPSYNSNNEEASSRSTEMPPEMRAELDELWKQKHKEWDEMRTCTLKNMIANMGDGSGSRC